MIEQHREAMKLAQEGFLNVEKDREKAIKLFEEAFILEREVAYSNKNNDEQTRAILFRSAASLAKLANNFSEANSLAKEGLAGNPPKEIFNELLSLLMNEKQSQFCFSANEYIRLLAPAGSGKTTALLWRCLNQLYNEEKTSNFLVFTFTKVARDELRDRIISSPELNRLQGKIRIETINQWGFNYIRNSKEGLQLKTSKQDFFFLVNNNLRPLWDKKPHISKLTTKGVLYKQIISIFSELKTLGFNHIVGSKKTFMKSFIEHYDWLKEVGLDSYFYEKVFVPVRDLELLNYGKTSETLQLEPFLNFWKDSSNELWDQSIITLEDQKYWALRILEKQYPDGKLFPAANRYRHVLVDEFQDINPLDLQLIEKLVEANNSSLSIVGDDDQAIYEWRGSSPKFIVTPDKFLKKDFQTIILNINYRSPKNIVELSQKLIELNVHREKKNIIPYSQEEAQINIKHFESHIKSLPFILDFAEGILKKGNETLAIISRKKGQLIPLQILLTSKEMSFYAKEDLNILVSQAFNELKRILIIAEEKNQRKTSETLIDDVLLCCNLIKKYPLSNSDKKPLKSFLIKNNPKTFLEAIIFLSKYDGTIKASSADVFSKAILKVISKKNVSDIIESIGECFEGLQKHYVKADDDIFYKEPPFLYLSDYAERYGDDAWAFIDHVEAAVNKMSIIYDEYQDSTDSDYKSKLHLMTALRAKGKEFDHVIILDVNDGLWPIKFAETKEQLEQERRLFYVAITRTKKTLTLITVDEIHGKPVFLSPYIKEMGLRDN